MLIKFQKAFKSLQNPLYSDFSILLTETLLLNKCIRLLPLSSPLLTYTIQNHITILNHINAVHGFRLNSEQYSCAFAVDVSSQMINEGNNINSAPTCNECIGALFMKYFIML